MKIYNPLLSTLAALPEPAQFALATPVHPRPRLILRCSFFLLILLLAQAAWPTSTQAQGVLTNGWVHQGSIAAAGEKDTWTLTAHPGERITVQVAETSGGAGFAPRLQIFSPDNYQLGNAADGVAGRLEIEARQSGDYTVVVSDRNLGGTGDYQLQMAQIPGAFTVPPNDEGGALTNGLAHAGTIGLGDLDPWTISANGGDFLVAQVTETSGGAGFSPRLELLAPDGTRLHFSSGATAGRVEAVAPAGGLYTVLVSDLFPTGAGAYELRVALLPGAFSVPAGDEGGVLQAEVEQEGSIAVGEFDLWSLATTENEVITVEVTELSGGAGFTPRLELFAPDGERKGAVQGGGGAVLTSVIENGGTYTVLISDALQSGNGTYRLRWSRAAIGTPAPNGLTNGGTFLGSIEPAGDEETWSFTASAGENIIVRVGEAEEGSPLTPFLSIADPSGTVLRSQSSQVAAEVAVRAVTNGTFTVTIRDNSSGRRGTGNYRLSLAKSGGKVAISPSDEGGALTNGWTYLGSIEAGDLDAWTFTAIAGESIVARIGEAAEGSSLTPHLRLYDPSGVLLAEQSTTVAAEVSARATNSGTFLLVVADNSSSYAGTGNYRLSLAKTGLPLAISPADEGGVLTNGITALGSITPGDIDAWTITANVGETIVARIGETAEGSRLTPHLRLYDPSGIRLDNQSTTVGAEVSARATNSGTFLLVVADNSSSYAGSGNYRLSLARTGSPLTISPSDEGGPLTNGATHVGSIDTGDLDPWTFHAEAGETIVVRAGETIAGSTLTPHVRLYDPSGAPLGGQSTTVGAEVAVRATNSGAFLLILSDNSSSYAGSGNYRLSLAKTGGQLVISPSDEGGLLTNGATQLGAIETGDLDAWIIPARTGDNILVRMGEVTAGSSLTPSLRLYDPSGAPLDLQNTQSAVEVTARATNSGNFLLVAADYSSSWAGTGNYRLTLVQSPGTLIVSQGDEGGPLSGTNTMDGSIEVGELDHWTFTACEGDDISIKLEEINTTSLSPIVRLYGRDGALLTRASGQTTAQISRQAPASGTYTVVIADNSSGYSGSGTYRLTVNGLSDGMKLCIPRRVQTNLNLIAIGGPTNAPLILHGTTNVTWPREQWMPILTNQFDQFGVLTVTNILDRSVPALFLRLAVPSPQ